jgi:H+/Cl- antiporter ClcA
MFGAIILGVAGGLLGASFIIINNQINIYRKKILKTKVLKIIESIILVILTVTTMYACVSIKHTKNYVGDST